MPFWIVAALSAAGVVGCSRWPSEKVSGLPNRTSQKAVWAMFAGDTSYEVGSIHPPGASSSLVASAPVG
jgi:hypothetical protein